MIVYWCADLTPNSFEESVKEDPLEDPWFDYVLGWLKKESIDVAKGWTREDLVQGRIPFDTIAASAEGCILMGRLDSELNFLIPNDTLHTGDLTLLVTGRHVVSEYENVLVYEVSPEI